VAKNFLKYSLLTYDEIMRQVNDKLNADERFANFRESSIAQTLVEIFAGTTDLISYMLERRAEESFFDTARLRSSVILLSRGLGYVVQRPVPAEARIKVKLKGKIEGLNSSSTIQVPIHSVFTYNGLKFILKNTITLNYADYQTALDSATGETDFILTDFNGDSIELIQGEIKEKVIEGNTNPQIGSTFQIYRIEDTEFSNRYGEEDFDVPISKVWVGDSKADENEYSINRRSLIDWEVIDAANAGETVNVCVVRTAVSEGTEILFGDGRFAQYGAQTSGQGARTSNDNIYIQYLATKGQQANQVGVKDKKIQFAGKAFDSNGQDVTDKIEFYFHTNITGGADMEDIDSIRVNAPNIYYSLDRLVSKRDYVNYLKSLTSPINIKNAIAWGEQEELNERGLEAMIRMFNVVFFSVVGPLYQTDISPYYVKTKATGLDTAVLDYNFDDDELNERNYFNVFTKGYSVNQSSLVEQLKEYEGTTFVWKMIGDNLDTDKNGQYYTANYGANFEVVVNYSSSIVANNPSLSASTTVTADVSLLNGYSNFDDAMTQLASLLQTSFRAITDERGNNTAQNANFNNPAFSDIVFTYLPDDNKFVVEHGLSTPAYIYSLEGVPDFSLDSASDLGISTSEAYEVTTNKELSKKIITVVEDIQKRSQITTRSIYISPVIQSMKLVGNVYLKDLYDKPTEKTNIEDAIYYWLNNNADFNTEIYISNVVELIEQFPSVLYADVRFVPSVPVNPDGGAFYQTGNHPSVEKQGTDTSAIYSIIDSQISSYIITSDVESDTSGTSEKSISYSVTGGIKTAQSYTFAWARGITERTFLETFAKNLYLALRSAGYTTFADSDDFINLVSDIHKDYLEIIRYNLVDTQGNIAKDNQVDSTGKTLKGGYSLGNEIVKVKAELSYEYKR